MALTCVLGGECTGCMDCQLGNDRCCVCGARDALDRLFGESYCPKCYKREIKSQCDAATCEKFLDKADDYDVREFLSWWLDGLPTNELRRMFKEELADTLGRPVAERRFKEWAGENTEEIKKFLEGRR